MWQQRSEDPGSIIFKGVLGKYMAWLHFGSKYPDIHPELGHKIIKMASGRAVCPHSTIKWSPGSLGTSSTPMRCGGKYGISTP